MLRAPPVLLEPLQFFRDSPEHLWRIESVNKQQPRQERAGRSVVHDESLLMRAVCAARRRKYRPRSCRQRNPGAWPRWLHFSTMSDMQPIV
jgi:hypothetical protein